MIGRKEDKSQMKRREYLISIAAAAVLVPPSGRADELRKSNTRKKHEKNNASLFEIDNTWAKAEKEGDLSSLQKLLDEDFTLIDFDGTTYTKSGYLDSIRKTKFLDYSVTDQVAHRWDQTGIVIGKWRSKWVFDGKEDHGTLRFTAVFSRRGDVWRAVAESVVKLAE